MADEKMDNWKQFQGSELGSLMGSIYGNENKPKINYPKPKSKARAALPSEPFLPGGAKAGASDPRKATKVDKKVVVPLVGKGGGRKQYSKVDFIPHRRSQHSSKAEIDEIVMRQQHFRPAHVKAVSTDAEKDKYSQICTFKGGKGLPDEMLHPRGEAPFEREQRRELQKREQQDRDRRAARRGEAPARVAPAPKAPLSHRESLATQISAEIQERCDHLEEMEALGGADTSVVRREISQRVAQLKLIERGEK